MHAINDAMDIPDEEIEYFESTSLETLLRDIESTADLIDQDVLSETAITPALESLVEVLNTLRTAGGISRNDAKVIRSMTASMEGFDKSFEGLPLNSFTEIPSKVNFDVSMESVVGDIWRKILAAVKKVIAFIRDKIKGNRTRSAQIAAACTKVSKEHKPLTEALVVKAATEALTNKSSDSAPASPMVGKIVSHAKKAEDVPAPKAVAEVVKTHLDELEKQLPDLYIMFYSDNYFAKLNADCEKLIAASGQVSKDFNASRFLDIVDDILSNYLKEPMPTDVAMTGELGKAGGAQKMLKSASTVRQALSDANRLISAHGRRFELIKKTDPLSALNKIAPVLGRDGKGVVKDLDQMTETTLKSVEKGIDSLQATISRSTGSDLELAQEKIYLLDIAKDVAMFGWNRHYELIGHVGKMVKLVHQHRI